MSKKDPAYETGWHTTGTLEVLPGVQQLAQRLDANEAVELHGLSSEAPDGWWSYDAVWSTKDGARIRGRLCLYNQNPNDPPDPEMAGMVPQLYDPESAPLPGFFHVYADADRTWDTSWPSPLEIFLGRKMKPRYVSLDYSGFNGLTPKGSRNLPELIQSLSELGWVAVVFTHDDLVQKALSGPNLHPDTPLISRLPSSLYGRVIDMRVLGENTRLSINRTLTRYKTELPRNGAAIVLSRDRRKGLQPCELTFPMDRPFVQGGDIGPLARVLVKLFESHVIEVDRAAIDELRGPTWTLMTSKEQAEKDAELMVSAANEVAKLRKEKGELERLLGSCHKTIEKFKENGFELVRQLEESREREAAAKEHEKRIRKEFDRLLCMIRDSDLGKANAARDAAQAEAEAAEELLDEQMEELNSARQEITRLRKELARAGSSAMIPAQRVQEVQPDSWDALLTWAATLDHVVLGDVQDGIGKLRGQTQEGAWVTQAWKALRALEEYAQMKKERGSTEVPHFAAYLKDPLAERAIPWTKFSSVESKGVMMNGKFVAARTLPVPIEVDPSGYIVMESHIRVGSGKPPAPRLHFHDDTSGATGKIYVGHLGPHLPNYQTN